MAITLTLPLIFMPLFDRHIFAADADYAIDIAMPLPLPLFSILLMLLQCHAAVCPPRVLPRAMFASFRGFFAPFCFAAAEPTRAFAAAAAAISFSDCFHYFRRHDYFRFQLSPLLRHY